ncbi:MAG TPA: hypothetical protein ENJ53_00800 [Phaeodactylibacter sp.]|nr:hypothetical protein [Phaeodactylibacter sp.]
MKDECPYQREAITDSRRRYPWADIHPENPYVHDIGLLTQCSQHPPLLIKMLTFAPFLIILSLYEIEK